ncbi:MAG: nitronate monooxygenase [Deltaproteobacteria bacterium]|nr:nitronate monooxygenase [Deltaproteobacteria bacterium]
MKWKTRLTELLNCDYPILQAALSRIGNWKFAAAVSEAGAHGCLTAAVSMTPEKLREDIRRCKDATDKDFSVNITIGMCPHIDEMLDVVLQAHQGCGAEMDSQDGHFETRSACAEAGC